MSARLRPRRLGLAVLIALLGFGCGPEPAPSAPAPEAAPSAAPLAEQPVPPAQLTLLEPGAAPRAPLRLVAPAAGADRQLEVASTFTVTPSQDGTPLPARQLQERRQVSVVHEGTDSAGASAYVARLGSLSRDGAPAPAGLEGRRARWTVDARGQLLRRGVQTDGLDPADAAQLDQMLGGLAELFVPLPEEPLGIGARWTVAETVEQPGGRETRTTTWMLVTRDDRGFVLTGETTGELVPSAAAAQPGPPTRRFFGESRVAFVAQGVLPDRVDSRGLSTRSAVVTRPDGQPGTLSTETRWETAVSEAGSPD